MESSAFIDTVFQLVVGVFLVSAVLILWRRQLAAMLSLLALNGVSLGLLALVIAHETKSVELVVVAVFIVAFRGVVLPVTVVKLVARMKQNRESAATINTSGSLISIALLTLVAYAVSRPIVKLDPSYFGNAAPVAIAVVFYGVFLLAVRKRTVSQITGFLLVDNGIAALAFVTRSGIPLIVDVALSLDLFFLVLVLQVLGGRLQSSIGTSELDELRELTDRLADD